MLLLSLKWLTLTFTWKPCNWIDNQLQTKFETLVLPERCQKGLKLQMDSSSLRTSLVQRWCYFCFLSRWVGRRRHLRQVDCNFPCYYQLFWSTHYKWFFYGENEIQMNEPTERFHAQLNIEIALHIKRPPKHTTALSVIEESWPSTELLQKDVESILGNRLPL
jgi:hypothetical protein